MNSLEFFVSISVSSIFILSLATILCLVFQKYAHKLFPTDKLFRQYFYVSAFSLVLLKIMMIVGLTQTLEKDALLYYNQIQIYSENPFEWNPFGPRAPMGSSGFKSGMPYLYSLLIFPFQQANLATVLSINLFLSMLATLVVALITQNMAAPKRTVLFSFLLAGVYPEMSFWIVSVLRETLSLLIIALIAYLFLIQWDRVRLKPSLGIAALSVILMLTRAQLLLLVILMVFFYAGKMMISQYRTHRVRVVFSAVFIMGLGVLLGYLTYARIAAVTSGMLMQRGMDLLFSFEMIGELLTNLSQVLALKATGANGAMGILLIPFVATSAFCVFYLLFRLKGIFAENSSKAVFLLFLTSAHLLGLAVTGYLAIRFRTPVTPLYLPVVAITIVDIWRFFRLPRIRFFQERSTA